MKRLYRKLVKQQQDKLFSLAARLLGSSAEAEDVVQDVLVKLWEHLPRLESERVIPWLIQVTRNACMDQLRRRKVAHNYVTATINGESQVHSGPADACKRNELGNQLTMALQELDEPYRSLVILRDVEGYAYREISQSLSLSESQVKVYLHRARQRLRQFLTAEVA